MKSFFLEETRPKVWFLRLKVKKPELVLIWGKMNGSAVRLKKKFRRTAEAPLSIGASLL